MGIFEVICGLMVLIFGFVIGMFSGAFFAQNNAPEVIHINELLALGFTILGGAGGFFATAIALFVWAKWKYQQRNIKLYDSKVSILTQLHILMIQTGNMAVMRANPSDSEANSIRESLVETLSKLHVELTIYEMLTTKLSVRESIDLHNLKHLPEIAVGILDLNTWPKKDTIDVLYVSSTTEWKYDRAKEFIHALPYDPVGVGLRKIKLSHLKDELDNILDVSTKKLCIQL